MVITVSLWMFYPLIVDLILNNVSLFYLAAIIHSIAALGVSAYLYFRINKNIFNYLLKNYKKLLYPVLLSGILICANHLLLYYALSLTDSLDVIAILFFETWTLLFVYFNAVYRSDKIHLSKNDIIFSLAAFLGFIILTLEHFDFNNLKLESGFIPVAGFAFLGGVAMALNSFARIKCLDRIKSLSEENSIPISDFNISLIAEGFVRIVAAPFFILSFFISDESVKPIGMFDFSLILFVGLFIIALGSVLYDLAIYQSKTSAVASLWYLTPIGSVSLIALYNMELLSYNEFISLFILITSNLLIAFCPHLNVKKAYAYLGICFFVTILILYFSL